MRLLLAIALVSYTTQQFLTDDPDSPFYTGDAVKQPTGPVRPTKSVICTLQFKFCIKGLVNLFLGLKLYGYIYIYVFFFLVF